MMKTVKIVFDGILLAMLIAGAITCVYTCGFMHW